MSVERGTQWRQMGRFRWPPPSLSFFPSLCFFLSFFHLRHIGHGARTWRTTLRFCLRECQYRMVELGLMLITGSQTDGSWPPTLFIFTVAGLSSVHRLEVTRGSRPQEETASTTLDSRRSSKTEKRVAMAQPFLNCTLSYFIVINQTFMNFVIHFSKHHNSETNLFYYFAVHLFNPFTCSPFTTHAKDRLNSLPDWRRNKIEKRGITLILV